MSLRLRILATYSLLVIIGFASLAYWIRGEFRNSYSFVVEELLVDVSNLVGSFIEKSSVDKVNTDLTKAAFEDYKRKNMDAKIFNYKKKTPTLDAYVTDLHGNVIFSSRGSKDEGKNYSQWNDVYLTLKGSYGARSTRLVKDDANTSVYFVGTPLTINNQLSGMASVIKTEESILIYLRRLIQKMTYGVIIGVITIIGFGFLLFFWLTKPLNELRLYALNIAEGKKAKLPNLKARETRELGSAFEEMRVALEGKKTIEKYTQALTHEMKSPLTAIKGAAELCQEPMSDQQRELFLNNIVNESERAKKILEQLLKIAKLEAQRGLESTDEIDLLKLIEGLNTRLLGIWKKRNLNITITGEPLKVNGDSFLEQAIRNLVENAIEFSKDGSTIQVDITREGKNVQVSVTDSGCGIPDYATDRVFEKFYSLERPDTKKKGSGLGLSFVKEVAELHNGYVAVDNLPKDKGSGVRATLGLSIS